MKNYLYTLAGLIDESDIDAKKYIEKLTDRLEKTKLFSNTGNPAIDSVINYKLSQAVRKGIDVKTDICFPKQLQENEDHFISILGNLLDNAIEAAEILKENRYLILKIQYRVGAVFIHVINSFSEIPGMKALVEFDKDGNLTEESRKRQEEIKARHFLTRCSQRCIMITEIMVKWEWQRVQS